MIWISPFTLQHSPFASALGVFAPLRETLCLLVLLLASQSRAGDLSLQIQESWSNVFGGTTVVYHAVVSGDGAIKGTVTWNLAVDQRTLSSGEQGLDAEGIVPISLTVPEIKAGVVMEAALSVAFRFDGATDAATSLVRQVWMFSPDPFGGRAEWLKSLDIHLYDPEGRTAAVWAGAGIPFTTLNSVEAISRVDAGTVVIGESIHLDQQRGLADAIMRVASAGTPVLCLAPAAGSISLSPLWRDGFHAVRLQSSSSLSFYQTDILTQLDKRLDAVAIKSALDMVAMREIVQGRFSTTGQWPWVEMTFPILPLSGPASAMPTSDASPGRVIFCGFGVIDPWDAGPAPRYVLREILGRLNGVQSDKE